MADHLEPYLDRLMALPFINAIKHVPITAAFNRGLADVLLEFDTPAGPFKKAVEVKKFSLTRAVTHSIVNDAKLIKAEHNLDSILFATYLPRPTAEYLSAQGINFVDAAGNLNITFGTNYQALIIGRMQGARREPARLTSPAAVQLLFTLAAHPESATWSARQLAAVAGISKSVAADVKQRFFQEGLVREINGDVRFREPAELRERLLFGYTQVLRPKLLIDRFRPSDRGQSEFLARITKELQETHTRWALTGAAAAHALQGFYRSEETGLFLNEFTPEVQQRLKLLPDRHGPVSILRAFGTLAFWKTVSDLPIAHPWLVYAELMDSVDVRAHEAAEELRREYLQ